MLPKTITIKAQVVDLTFPRVLIFHLSFFYVYPLTEIYPVEKCKFLQLESVIPDVKSVNEKLDKKSIGKWNRIEKSNKSLILYYGSYKYLLPFVTFDISEFPTSSIRISLNFSVNSDFSDFEKDRIVAIRIIKKISEFNKRKINWKCIVDSQKFAQSENEGNVIYAENEEMKDRIDYLRKVTSFYIKADIISEEQLNKYAIFTSRKLTEFLSERKGINTYLIENRDHQLITINSSVFVFKKHVSEESARNWLDKKRLISISKLSFTRKNSLKYPNVKYQFFIESYDTVSEYLENLLEDVDGYKIAIIEHQNSFYTAVPIFIPYKRRAFGDREDVIGIDKNSYWTLDNSLYMENSKIEFPFRIENIVSVSGNKLLTADGIVWSIENNTAIKIYEDVLKLTDGCFLTYTGELFSTTNKKLIDSSVENTWSFENTIIYKKNQKIIVLGNTILPTNKNWKTLTPSFGLTYEGKVFDLSKNREIDFQKQKLLQINEYEGNLFAWNKKYCFWRKLDNTIELLKGEISFIINENRFLDKSSESTC
jgi:hypothetical protein